MLRAQARKFVERYKPDLVKFDFGYELPPLSVAAPKDMRWAGERLMLKGLEVVVGGMREANPDIVVMYYCLSPLFHEYFDLHSPDDLFMAVGRVRCRSQPPVLLQQPDGRDWACRPMARAGTTGRRCQTSGLTRH